MSFPRYNDRIASNSFRLLLSLCLVSLLSTAFSFQTPIVQSSPSTVRRSLQPQDTIPTQTNKEGLHAFLDPTASALGNVPSPYATTALGSKASAADYVVQRKDARKMDLRRNFGLAVYGAIFQGMALQLIGIYPSFLGTAGTQGALNVTAKVAFNLVVRSVFLTLPLAYLIKGRFHKRPARQSLDSYDSDVRNKGLLRMIAASGISGRQVATSQT